MTGGFLEEPPMSPQVQALYDEDLEEDVRGRNLRPAC